MSPTLVRSEQPRLHSQCLRLMRLYLKYPGGWFTLSPGQETWTETRRCGCVVRMAELAPSYVIEYCTEHQRPRRSDLLDEAMALAAEYAAAVTEEQSQLGRKHLYDFLKALL